MITGHATRCGTGAVLTLSLVTIVFANVAARAQEPSKQQKTTTVELKSEANKVVAVASRPKFPAKDELVVVCAGLDCREVKASVTPGSDLSPLAGASATQVRFQLPDVKPGASLQIRVCATAMAAACAKSAPVLEMLVEAEAEPPTDQDKTQLVKRSCAAIGVAQTAEVMASRGKSDFTVIIFDETGPCYLNRQFGAEGDPIAIGFAYAGASPPISLELDPCGTPSAIPKVLIGGDISSITLQAAEELVPQIQWFPPLRQCFGNSAGVKISMEKGQTTKTVSYALKQFERYRATLQLGVAASTRHKRTFGLRQDGAVKKITETSAVDRGPEYVAATVIYGLPRYFHRPVVRSPRFIEKLPVKAGGQPVFATTFSEVSRRETYYGRDPINENGLLDRIGLLAGAGVTEPGRRFLIGVSFELLTGVNVFLSREFLRSPKLHKDLQVDAEFVGEATAIPTQEEVRKGWTLGLSFDARYALAIFGKK